MHIELRVRTICEFAINEEYYLQSDIVSHLSGLVGQSVACIGSEECTILRQMYMLECIDATKLDTYCSMWHIYALSSVLKCPIFSVYPEKNPYVRQFNHKVVQPRVAASSSKQPLHIMWTRTTPAMTDNWSPNHFVPCIEMHPMSKENMIPMSSKPVPKASALMKQNIKKKATPMKKGIAQTFFKQKSSSKCTDQSSSKTYLETNTMSVDGSRQGSTNIKTTSTTYRSTLHAHDSLSISNDSLISLAACSQSSSSKASASKAKETVSVPKASTLLKKNLIPNRRPNTSMTTQINLFFKTEGSNDAEVNEDLVGDDNHSLTDDLQETDSLSDVDMYSITSSEGGSDYDDLEIVGQSKDSTEPYRLPFSRFSRSWYIEQDRMLAVFKHERDRNATRKEQPPVRSNSFELISMSRGRVEGKLVDNIQTLEDKIATIPPSSKRAAHLKAIVHAGSYILENGPLLKTQQVSDEYLSAKHLTRKRLSCEIYELLSKYLNITQIYIGGVAYIIPSMEGDMEKLVNTINGSINKQSITKEVISERLHTLIKPSLEYMDTHRDRQVLKALLAELTSVKFSSFLQGIKSRQGTAKAKNDFKTNLKKFSSVKESSQIVRNDMTNIQQYRLTQRIISTRKRKEIRTIAEGRGRKLKCDVFPELKIALQYAFGELDIQEGGGGLESHPRLTTDTLYRGTGNATTMPKARQLLLLMAPSNFTISLSSCYNYTQNYREGTFQAKRHHAGKDVNAPISLRMPPRTGVKELVINLHWSTSNVNNLINQSEASKLSTIISKDAKAIVLADIAPVQHPGHSWKPRELPDHSWDQSRTNAITPMTFLFINTRVTSSSLVEGDNDAVEYITRSGQGVTLLYLSFFEPDTTFKCMNEIFYLFTLPALQQHFEDCATGHIKKELVFVVDNGPQEKPSNPLVQMCMVRILQVLKLHKITQVSFAEYHSKRNFVERVHAEENRVLSKHGPFSSCKVHPSPTVGSSEHMENMEAMAIEVAETIETATFGRRKLVCKRGVKKDDFLFDDEQQLTTFLSMSEGKKEECTNTSYKLKTGALSYALNVAWGIDEEYTGDYLQDYKLMSNKYNVCTSWTDKYTSTFYTPAHVSTLKRFELQPLPDYVRWLKCCEFHYMPWTEACKLQQGIWEKLPGLFVPSRILDLCFICFDKPTPDVLKLISILAWVPPNEVEEYFSNKVSQNLSTIQMDEDKAKWEDHPLYHNTKEELIHECRLHNIPVKQSLNKVQLIKLIAAKKGETEPAGRKEEGFAGNISAIPTTITSISKLQVSKLRQILAFYKLPIVGTKEELALRVFLLRNGQFEATIAREEEELKDFISQCKSLIIEELKLAKIYTSHTYQRRTHSSSKVSPKLVTPPSTTTLTNLHNVFNPLLTQIARNKQARKERNFSPTLKPYNVQNQSAEDTLETIKDVGAKIKVKWSEDEIGDSGWKAGWYTAYVQSYDEETDTLTIAYPSEPGCTYNINFSQYLKEKKIKLT